MNKIHEGEYSPSDFHFRLATVQKLLTDKDVDALMVINGSDGADNKESAKLVNWLLKGNTGAPALSDFYLDPLFEESFMIVSKQGLSLFCSDELFKEYFAFIVAVPHRDVQVYKVSEAEKDKDAFEMHKIKEFYRLIEPHKTIGVVANEDDAKPLKKRVEEIPLVQSYALDGKLTRRGRKLLHDQERYKSTADGCREPI